MSGNFFDDAGTETIADKTIDRFNEMGLRDELKEAMVKNSFENPSEIQKKAIPIAINGDDLLCQAKSGKGKTAVFVLSILNKIDLEECKKEKRLPQVLVLCITHELAVQITNEFKRFSNEFFTKEVAAKTGTKKVPLINYITLIGGRKEADDISKLKIGRTDIVIGTLGRVHSLVKNEHLDLKNVKTFVADECDELFTHLVRPVVPKKVKAEIAAEPQAAPIENQTAETVPKAENETIPENQETPALPQEEEAKTEKSEVAIIDIDEKLGKREEDVENITKVKEIVGKMGEHQTMMFSATMPAIARTVCERFLNPAYKPLIVDKDTDLVIHNLSQYYMTLGEEGKLTNYTEIIKKIKFNQIIVFVKDDKRASILSKYTELNTNIKCDYISGRRKEEIRNEVFMKFKKGDIRIMVATDIFQRGVDFSNVNLVIHFDAPANAESYLHRTGRAGRFETLGASVGFFDPAKQEDMKVLEDVKSRFDSVSISEITDLEPLKVFFDKLETKN